MQEELLPDQINNLLPLIYSSKRKSINLVGGEPTLNPFFLEILIRLLEKNYEVKIFTNGRIPVSLVSEMQNISNGSFSFVLNRSYPDLSPELETFYKSVSWALEIAQSRSKQQNDRADKGLTGDPKNDH